MQKIFTGTDRARELVFKDRLGTKKFTSHREMQDFLLFVNFEARLPKEYTDKDPVYMRIDFSRMLAACECGGVSYVQPEDNYFFCNACKNKDHEGKLRRVIFPENLNEICEELLRRETSTPEELEPTQAACVAQGLPRSWNPGETVKDLQAQRLKE